MIEIIFSDSACGSLKMAQKSAEEQNRLEWENSVPLSGNTKDVFGFHLMLSVGDIANDDFIGGRQNR